MPRTNPALRRRYGKPVWVTNKKEAKDIAEVMCLYHREAFLFTYAQNGNPSGKKLYLVTSDYSPEYIRHIGVAYTRRKNPLYFIPEDVHF
jgi:hypothetical protein